MTRRQRLDQVRAGRRRRISIGLVALVVFALLVLSVGGRRLHPETHRLVVPVSCTPSGEGDSHVENHRPGGSAGDGLLRR